MENKTTTITIVNWAGINTGDDAIFSSLLDIIRGKITGDLKIYVLADDEKIIKIKYNIEDSVRIFEFYKFRNIQKVIEFLKKTNLIIYGGGDLINGNLHSMIFLLLAEILGLPVICCSVGAIPIKSQLKKFFTKLVLDNMKFITVRDEQSKHFLDSLNIKNPPIYIVNDLAFLLKPNLHQNEILNIINDKTNKSKINIGINVRPPGHMYSFYSSWNKDKINKIIAIVCDKVIDKYKAKIIFLPMVIRKRLKHYHTDLISDDKLSHEIIKLMKNKTNTVVIEEDYNPRDILGLISKIDLVIAMRLHALLLASNVGVPIIALSYSPKIDSFMDLLKQTKYCIPVNNLNQNKFLKLIDKRIKNKEEKILISKHLSKKTAEINGDMIIKTLNNTRKNIWRFYLLLPSIIIVSLIWNILTWTNRFINIFRWN